jgi:hypothetical protein
MTVQGNLVWQSLNGCSPNSIDFILQCISQSTLAHDGTVPSRAALGACCAVALRYGCLAVEHCI